ncbi:MAG: efflux RND transporter permease subunit [Jannaschia sp.]
MRHIENRLLQQDEIATIYAANLQSGEGEVGLIGRIQLELTAWDTRRSAAVIGEDTRGELAGIPGIVVQIETEDGGSAAGKPVDVRVMARDAMTAHETVTQIRGIIDLIGGFSDVTDTRVPPGVEWRIRVNRTEAARFGADIHFLGQAIQMLTQGITVVSYRPDDVQGAVDIRMRFPAQSRTLDALHALRVPTSAGLVPIANCVTFEPAPRSGSIERVGQKTVLTVKANITPGLLVDKRVATLRVALEAAQLPDGVAWEFAGEVQEQDDATAFLFAALVATITLMFGILITQLNTFYRAFVEMSAMLISVVGVLMGLLVTGRPFGVVMGGIGVIALAGIVVNNDIMLIDTYNDLRRIGQFPLEAASRTGVLRFRPVVLTSQTTVPGLMPMVIGINLDFLSRSIMFGSPPKQWWTELSAAIVGGLIVATLLTLLVTLAMLIPGERRANRQIAPP